MNRESRMRAIAAFALLATLAACASAPPAPVNGPLRAELTEDEFGARVHLNAPAYVAIFRITPGTGASLIYPRDQADRPQLRAGTHVIVPRTSSRGSRALAANANTYLYLVASKDPLEVEQFQDGDRDVRDVIGAGNATSNDLMVVMQSLDVALMSTEATVAGPWTSDVLTPWERLASRGNGEGSRGGLRSIGGEQECKGVRSSGFCRGVQTTPAERRASRRGTGVGGSGATGGAGGGANSGSKPTGGASSGNN